ncbi:MAG: class 1 fructose-bisphosphatase, partial [Gammaproteobacteria bacterium]
SQAGREEIAGTVLCIATAAAKLAGMIARNAFAPAVEGPNSKNSDGDTQSLLDVQAHKLFEDALANTAVGLLASEESEEATVLNRDAPLGVAIDPLDGSSNIDTNLSLGAIFSIYDFGHTNTPLSKESFNNIKGTDQVAAGFFVFGPQTNLVLTLLNGTQMFSMDPETSEFLLVHENIQIPESQREFAINASNYRFWDDSIRGYIDDCIAGESGPRGENFNMRWVASLVAETCRILVRGGIFLYPRDLRPGYENGRLRLLYEAFPIALLVEQAGGAATDGETRILDRVTSDLHGRVPLIFGSNEKVERVARYYATPPVNKHRFALFEPRQLLRK